MRKRTITILALVMGVSLLSLLALQMNYIDGMLEKRKQHFEESVSRSLYQVAHKLEVDEVTRYLEQGAEAMEGIATAYDTVVVATDSSFIKRTHKVTAKDGSVYSTLETTANTNVSDKYFTKNKGNGNSRTQSLKRIMEGKYAYEKKLLDEVIYSLLYTASDRPLTERINFKDLDQNLRSELANNGVDIPYHFRVLSGNGREVYRCPDYESEGEKECYSESLFKNDPVQKMAVLKVHFPDQGKVIASSVMFFLPSVAFTVILLITFVVTLVLTFRQKKLAEVKNDFINNMTHEFKTPISSISLAAQMLKDDSVKKSPQMLSRLYTTIYDETKRLRFQVEKVLQLSMYEHGTTALKMREINANELISGVIHTFALKVEKNGGKIISDLVAKSPVVCVDEMHFTNVIFNLMDNAVKYKRGDVDLELKVSTWNEGKKLCISIQDNGIGIKKDDLKKIFDKFYRVHTGNLHDVKGFGLGLAYVNKIITDHKGSIHAESELGIGTKFIIKMQAVEDAE